MSLHQNCSITKIFPSRFPGIFATIFQLKIIPVYSNNFISVLSMLNTYNTNHANYRMRINMEFISLLKKVCGYNPMESMSYAKNMFEQKIGAAGEKLFTKF